MKTLIKLEMVVISVLILVSGAQGTMTVLNTTDDAEIDQHVNWANDTKGIPHPNWNWDASELRVRIWDPAYGDLVSNVLLKWDLGGIAASEIVTDVTVQMAGWDWSDAPIDVYGIKMGDWNEATVTWNSWTATPQNLVLLGQLTSAGPASVTGDTLFSSSALTDWVQDWIDGSQANYGLILKMSGTTAGGDSFSSHEDTWVSGHAPQLIINHIPEPASLSLLSLGLLTLIRRRK